MANQEVGNLVIQLTASSTKLEGDLTRATGKIQYWTNQVQALSAGSLSSLPVLGPVIGFVEQLTEGFRQAQKEAQTLGVSMQQLATIKFAAKGADQDQLSAGLIKVEKALDEAARGSSEAQSKFSSLGLSWQDLAGLTLDETMLKISQRINELPPGMERVHAATELMGKDAATLVPALEKMAGNFDKAKERASGATSQFNLLNAEFQQGLIVIKDWFAELGKQSANDISKVFGLGGQNTKPFNDLLNEQAKQNAQAGKDSAIAAHFNKVLDGIRSQTKELGAGTEAWVRMKAAADGFNETQIQKLIQANLELQKQKDRLLDIKEAQRIKDDIASPEEKLKKQVEELQRLKDQSKDPIGDKMFKNLPKEVQEALKEAGQGGKEGLINDDEFIKAAEKARDKLFPKDKEKLDPTKGAGEAAERGSAQALKDLAEIQNRALAGDVPDVQKQQVDILKKILDELKKEKEVDIQG